MPPAVGPDVPKSTRYRLPGTSWVCVECAKPVPSVMHATNRLTQCATCGSFADKYVEYESALIALDMLLHRRSVYRHMLCNNTKSTSRVALLELVSALCLFDAYLNWLRLGGQPWISREACYDGVLPSIAMLWSVVPALLLSLAEQALFCAVVGAVSGAARLTRQPWEPLTAAALISSFGKGFAVLHMIWSYPDAFLHAIEGFAFTCNCVALAVQLRCDVQQAVVVVAVGGAAKSALMLVATLQ